MSTPDPEAQAAQHAAAVDRDQLVWATLLAAGIEALADGHGGEDWEPSVARHASVIADAGLAEFRSRWPAA